MSVQARAFFDEKRYFQAAQSYAQCSVTFEEVSLMFLDAGERDALRSYLISRLERTKRSVSNSTMGSHPVNAPSQYSFVGYVAANDAGNMAG